MAKNSFVRLKWNYRVVKYRNLLGYSISEMAKRMGVAKTTYQSAEKPSSDTTAVATHKLIGICEFVREETSRLSDGQQVLFLNVSDLIIPVEEVE